MVSTRTITLTEQITCLRREIGYREHVYNRWVAAGKMKADKADYEIAAMKAALATLVKLYDEQNPELLPAMTPQQEPLAFPP
jgi:nickel-dependent lactate racemase